MATRREVDLVIRARNEASSAIQAISKALQEFSGAQEDINKQAGKTKSSLTQVGESLRKLSTSLGSDATRKLAEGLGNAATQVKLVGAALADATGEAIGYTKESRIAAEATAKLRTESEKVVASIKKQSGAVQQSKAANAELSKIIAKAATDRAKLQAAERKLTDEIEKQSLKLALARGAFQSLQAEIAETANPTKRLEASFVTVGNAITKTVSKLEELRTTQAVVRNTIDQTGQAVERATARLGSQAAAFDKNVAALARLEERQKGLKIAVAAAAAEQAKLEASSRGAVAALEKQDAAFRSAADELQRLQAESNETGAAIGALAGKLRGPLLTAFGQQRKAVIDVRAEWVKAQERVKALALSMRSVEEPTREMAEAFERAKTASASSKQEFIAQRDALHEMRSILRETGGDLAVFQDRLARLQVIQAKSVGSLKKHKAASKEAGAADREAGAAAQQAAQGTRALSAEQERLAAAERQATKETLTLAGALRRFYGNSRTALSFTQRLRSEILALAAAYGGFFAIFAGVRNVVQAFQALEAAQSRLNVVFAGNQLKVAAELDFIRRNSERLGIQFGILAQEYTKFAVATQGSNLEGKETRRIFIAVAEASRVNKLTLENLKGVFVALTQIVSKGVFNMEELRQQLGDRLPGALQILAGALDVSVERLAKLVETGKVSSDRLSEFADELILRFGDQLGKALKQTTTEIGRFQNALFQALITVGKSNFIEAFTEFLRDFTEVLGTADAQTFLQNLGTALAGVTSVLAALVRNFDLLVIAITGFIASRLAPFALVLGARFGRLKVALLGARTEMALAAASARSLGIAGAGATLAIGGLGSALRVLLSSTGIGLLITLIGVGIGAWATRADEATEAMVRHRKVVDTVKNAYDAAGGDVEVFAEAVADVSDKQARSDLLTLTKLVNAARDALRAAIPTRSFGAAKVFVEQLNQAFEDFETGAIPSTEKLVEALQAVVAASDDPGAKALGRNVIAAAKDLDHTNGRALELSKVIEALGGDMAAAAEIAGDFADETDETAKAARRAALDLTKYEVAMARLAESVPEVADELERLSEAAELEGAFEAALEAANGYEQMLAAFKRYQAALREHRNENLENVFGQGFADRIIEIESGGRVGQKAGTSTASGLGGFIESTWLRLFQKHFPDEAETLTEPAILALRDNQKIVRELIELLARENSEILRKAGEAVTDVALQLAHFLGPRGAINVLQAAGDTPLADLLTDAQIEANPRTLGGDKTASDLIAFSRERLGLSEQQVAVQAELARLRGIEATEAERDAKAQEKRAESTAQAIADGAFAIDQQKLLNAEKDREAAINEAIRAAKQTNADISKAELNQIRQQAAALFDLQNLEREREALKEQAQKADAEVNNLLTIRVQLTEQLKLLEETGAGSVEQINATRDGIFEINELLRTAIDRTLGFYEALGGTEADAAIAKLNTVKLTLDTDLQKSFLDLTKIAVGFGNGFAAAFDNFAQKIAAGENAIKSAKNAFLQFAADFLRLIAQMILKQIALNIASAIAKALGAPLAPTAHSGGLVGQVFNRRRAVHPATFVGAMRMHSGGIAGLKRNEIPIIAERGEEILTDDDPRHRTNLGRGARGSASEGRVPRIINAFDGTSFLEEALSTPEGEEAFLNFVRANPSSVRAAIGV